MMLLKSISLVCLLICAAVLLSSCNEGEFGKTVTDTSSRSVEKNTKLEKNDISKIYAKGKCLIVDRGNPTASDKNPGTPKKPFLTINAATQKASAGWTVLVREGVYRERIEPVASGTKKNPIVFQGVGKDKVIVKGSEVWTPKWTATGEKKDIFKATIDSGLFKDGVNPFLIGISIAGKDKDIVARPSDDEKLPYTLGQIFVNGKPLEQVQTRRQLAKTLGSWLVSANGKSISIKLPQGIESPSDSLIEISVRNRIFCPRQRGLKYIHVKGFTFEHCANQGPFPQGGAVSVRSGRNWVIEDNIIRYAKMIGLDCGSETWDVKNLKDTDKADKRLILGGGHIIRNNIISDNGLCGIAGWNHKGTKIINNILERNNRLKIDKKIASWEEWGAIKLHCSDALIEGNLIRDNNEFGIWIDNGYKNARIVRNLLHNNQGAGIFLELGAGRCLIANNVISATRSKSRFYKGFGVYAHDAGGITVANNLLINNSGDAVLMRTITNRKCGGKLSQTSNEKIFNNLMVNNGKGIALPLEYKRGKNNQSNYNLFSYDSKLTFGFPWSIGGVNTKKKMAELKAGNPKFEGQIKDWEDKKGISIALWQVLTGLDKNSLFEKKGVTIKLDPASFTVSITPGNALLKMKCPTVRNIENDLLGDVISGKYVVPGPFQNLKPGTNTYRLWPLPENKSFFDSGLPISRNGKIVQEWSYTKAPKNGCWLKVQESKKNLEFTAPIEFKKSDGSLMMFSRATGGEQKAPGAILMFKSPQSAWYEVNLSGELVQRTAKTAGYCRLQIYLLSDDSKKSKLIETFNLNKKGGYSSETCPEQFKFQRKIGLLQGWKFCLRFQTVSPGPANAGQSMIKIDQFDISIN